LARNKRRSERSSRCAARAALNLKGNNTLPPYPLQQNPNPHTLFRGGAEKNAEFTELSLKALSSERIIDKILAIMD